MEGMRSTLIIDLSHIPAVFGLDRIMLYITTDLGLSREQLERVHYRTSTKMIIVDVVDPSVAIRVLSDREPTHAVITNGDVYGIPITMNDGLTIVKLHDLSPDITDYEIEQYMERFGTVLAILEDEWTTNTPLAGLPNGYRKVYMLLNDIVPERITIGGERTLATHHGQLPLWRGNLARPPGIPMLMQILAPNMRQSPENCPCQHSHVDSTSRNNPADVTIAVPSSSRNCPTPAPTTTSPPAQSTSTFNAPEPVHSESPTPRIIEPRRSQRLKMLDKLMANLKGSTQNADSEEED